MTSEDLKSLLAPEMAEVDAVIHRRLSSQVALVNQISHYIVNAGGKRLRPMLLVLIARALGCTNPQRFELAAIARTHDALTIVDAVTSFGGVPLDVVGERGLDDLVAELGELAEELLPLET